MSELPDCPECGPPNCPLGEYAERIADLEAENQRLREALQSIAKNTCCEPCQEAKLVAKAALSKEVGDE